MYVLVGEFRISWIFSTVPLTQFLGNAVFSNNQNARLASSSKWLCQFSEEPSFLKWRCWLLLGCQMALTLYFYRMEIIFWRACLLLSWRTVPWLKWVFIEMMKNAKMMSWHCAKITRHKMGVLTILSMVGTLIWAEAYLMQALRHEISWVFATLMSWQTSKESYMTWA